MSTESVTIKDFNLPMFSTLLTQATAVTPQLMLEFDKGIIKSASFSHTKSLIKLFTIPIDSLVIKETDDDGNVLSEDQILDEMSFDFYILKGDSFKNYLSVFGGSEKVDITFKLVDVGNVKKQASSLQITGISESGSKLVTEHQLTTEELISNQISDYSEILKHATPTKEMSGVTITHQQTTEIRGLIKKLHKSFDNNTSFLTFTFDEKNIQVKDKAFELNFPNIMPEKFISNEPITFNMLKGDFVLIGDHTFDIYTSTEEEKVIFGAKFSNAIIWIMSTKVNSNYVSDDVDVDGDSIEGIEVSEYIFD